MTIGDAATAPEHPATRHAAPPTACLSATALLDADHPDVRAFAVAAIGDATDDVTRAVRLYYAVRDDLRYDPYVVDYSPEGFRASAVLTRRRGYCVTKAGVLAAAGTERRHPGAARVRRRPQSPRDRAPAPD